MDFLFTQDPTLIIIFQQSNLVIYLQVESIESWMIYGECSHNGSCIDGAVNPDLRPYDQRLDCPIRPEIECEGCPLWGEDL